jgi:hypothetical protein
MRRSSALGICVITLVIAGAVPASASTILNLKTKAGGIAQPGAPARIFLSINPEIGEYCYAEVTGSIAVNGKPKDKVTFPGELAGRFCARGDKEGAIAGTVSVLEDTVRGLKLRSNIKYGGDPPCLYQFPPKLGVPFAGEVFTDRFEEVPGLTLRRISGPPKTCPHGDFAYVEFRLMDPQNGETYEDEEVHVGRARQPAS